MEAALGIFVASLAGSAHCAAMCGPFLLFASASPASLPPSRRWLVTSAYHGGRLVTYMTIGVAAGALGAGVDRLGALAGIGGAAAVVAGVLMVAWGVQTIRVLRGARSAIAHGPAWVQRIVHGLVRHVGEMAPVSRAVATGLTTALLPCGWLYAFAAAAGGTGSPGRAALVMAVFWTGTVPALALLGVGIQRLTGPLRSRLPILTVSAVVLIGLLSITGRLRMNVGRPGDSTLHAHVHGR